LANAEFRGTFIIFLLTLNFATKHFSRNWSGRRGSNSQLSAWEAEFSILYFQHLQNRSGKMYVHALRAVHALPDLRVAGGRLGDSVSTIYLWSTTRRSFRAFRKVPGGEVVKRRSYSFISWFFQKSGKRSRRWRMTIVSISST